MTPFSVVLAGTRSARPCLASRRHACRGGSVRVFLRPLVTTPFALPHSTRTAPMAYTAGPSALMAEGR